MGIVDCAGGGGFLYFDLLLGLIIGRAGHRQLSRQMLFRVYTNSKN